MDSYGVKKVALIFLIFYLWNMSHLMRFCHLFAYVSSKGSDEPAQTHNHARAFAACTHKVGLD